MTSLESRIISESSKILAGLPANHEAAAWIRSIRDDAKDSLDPHKVLTATITTTQPTTLRFPNGDATMVPAGTQLHPIGPANPTTGTHEYGVVVNGVYATARFTAQQAANLR